MQSHAPAASVVCGLLLCLFALFGCAEVPRSVADYCDSAEFSPPTDPTITLVSVQTSAPRAKCGRVFAPVWAAEGLEGISAEPRPLLASMFSANQTLIDAVRRGGDVPDVVWLSSLSAPDTIRALQALGDTLFPIDQCDSPFPAMAHEHYWYPLPDDPQRWGVPSSITVDPLFYSKKLLRQLGWTEAAIASLPDQIAAGQFTLADMLQTAEEAVNRGVVPSGLGFVPGNDFWELPLLLYLSHGGDLSRLDPNAFELDTDALAATFTTLDRLVKQQVTMKESLLAFSSWPNRIMFNDLLAKGEALFWVRPLDKWSYWETDHLSSPDSVLLDDIGVALFPSATPNQAGVLRSYRPSYYVILSEAATGRAHQQAACSLLAETMRSDHIGRYYVQFKALSPLADAAYPTTNSADAALFAQLTALLPYASEESFTAEPRYVQVRSAVFSPLRRIAEGATPDDVFDLAIQRARGTLGDNLILQGDKR